ncbi:thioredoxin family protein [Alkalibacter rhizosphaerae]|uniref:Thioredoxin family protein n=1 Tax=Alkalibacter rhizosphaerae TaxID=2815577 RepID=A0A974XGA1_9FIRM|nr:thioredoxin family protein [Alkalibacter rhizosphaerae]QSX09141.1 thioredoxin family protein [Alkalibacter rhizosphaerae]
MTNMTKQLMEIFEDAITYEEYVDLSEGEDRDKHLHYLQKMEMNDEEQKRIRSASLNARLLVFCDPQCPDCRIVTATLHNMEKHSPGLKMGLALQEKYEDLMKELEEEARIPMVIWLQEDDWKIIFYETPDFLKEQEKKQDEKEQKEMRIAFQRGLHKGQVVNQIIEALTM